MPSTRWSTACLGWCKSGLLAAKGCSTLQSCLCVAHVPQRHPRAGPARLVLLLAQLRRVCQVLQRAAAALAKVLAARRHLRSQKRCLAGPSLPAAVM